MIDELVQIARALETVQGHPISSDQAGAMQLERLRSACYAERSEDGAWYLTYAGRDALRRAR
jgi:hypothetical protein